MKYRNPINICNLHWIKMDNPNLENLFAIGIIGENLCKYLDCKSMLNVKEVSLSLYEAMEKQKMSFMRILQHRFTVRTGKDELLESWKEIVYKLTTENLEKLGLSLDPIHIMNRHNILWLNHQLADLPLFHFVAGSGDLELYR